MPPYYLRENENQSNKFMDINQKDLSEFTDEELFAEAKKMKSVSKMNAFFVGFLVAIVVYSVAKNTWGLVTIIPLYFIYRLVKDPRNKRKETIEMLMKERKLV